MRLTSGWDQDEGSFDRAFRLEDSDGYVVETFDGVPTLDKLRKAERDYGRRINLTNVGLPCSDCGTEIEDRFAATLEGDLLCWDCGLATESGDQAGVTVNTDPVEAIISESSLYKKSLCDYVINVATGCRHGCRFCYVPTTPAVERREGMLQDRAGIDDAQQDWGSYLLYRDDLPERLHEPLVEADSSDWDGTERGREVVMLSSGTDCYQDRRTAQITRACVQELVAHDRPVRILTRSPAVLRDLDLFKEAGDYVTVGSSLPTLDDDLVNAIEPGAPPPSARWDALDELRRAGVRRYVSMSPTYPTMDEHDIWNVLTHLKAVQPEVIFHEPINPRGANFQMCVEAARDAGLTTLASALAELKDYRTWVEYALEQINIVQRLANEIGGLQIHSWPDQQLLDATTGELRQQLIAMRKAVSPEPFPTAPDSAEEIPAQSPLYTDKEQIQSLVDI